jgi:hypothetical protein
VTGLRRPDPAPTDPTAPVRDRAPATAPGGARESALETAPLEPRPWIERIGLAFIAAILVVVFGVIAAASFATGELFLALMAGLGALMTAWAGGRTLLRG